MAAVAKPTDLPAPRGHGVGRVGPTAPTASDEEGIAMPEKWTVKGRVVVDHLLPELKEAFGGRVGVPGVTVKVSARSKIPTGWGWWNSWGKITTGADGRFSVSEN